MKDVTFKVEEAPEGGYIAEALGVSIVTEADDLAALHRNIRDAVRCHFDASEMPERLLLSSSCPDLFRASTS